MIINHRFHFVYIGPPKTATTSMHQWLTQPALANTRFNPKTGDQHALDIPLATKNYLTFATVRNPFDRAVSLWCHSQIDGQATASPLAKMDFPAFVAWIAGGEAGWFYSQGQADYLAGIRLDALIRVENLARELGPICKVMRQVCLEAIPRLNVTEHEPWPTYYTPGLTARVRDLWLADFRLGGYNL